MFTGCRRKHHLKAETSQKVTENLLKPPETNYKPIQKRDGFSEYKNFERESISGFCTHFSAERIISCKCTDENPGFSFTKRESRLQMGNLVYKTRISFTKWDSWSTNGTLGLLFTIIYISCYTNIHTYCLYVAFSYLQRPLRE